MDDELIITRNPSIGFDEWLAAAGSVAALRRDESDLVGRNPKTGEAIHIKAQPGTFAVQFGGDWIKVFAWHRKGHVTVAAWSLSLDEATTLALANELAAKLGAEVARLEPI